MDLPWVQAGYRALSEVEPPMGRRLLVGSQMIKMVKPGILAEAVDNEVTLRVEVGDIGRTTVEFRCKIFFGRHHVADGSVVMILAAGTPGNFKPSIVPEDVKALAAGDPSSNAKFMKETLAAMPKDAPLDSYTTRVLVRYSDEDVNKHANHSAQARFFEDAKEIIMHDANASPVLRDIAQQQLEAIMISYSAEVSAMDSLHVKASPSSTRGIDVWVYRTDPKPTLVARGHMICSGGRIENSDVPHVKSSKL